MERRESVLRTRDSQKAEVHLEGIPASPGIVMGTAFVKSSEPLVVPKITVPESRVEGEVKRFKSALDETKLDLMRIKASLEESMGEDHAKIFDAHLMILEDTMAVDDTISLIRSERRSAASAFQKVIGSVLRSFKDIEDEYLKDRYADIMDVKKRVLRKLLGKGSRGLDKPTSPSIIVARDLAPSDTAQFDRRNTLGYATDLGGPTSHTAILARSQGVPAVVGLERFSSLVEEGDTVIVDGNCGTVIVNPSEETLELYRKEIERFTKMEEQLLTLTRYPAETIDGKRIAMGVNVDMPQEVDSAASFGAEGIGLFRTEYFFIVQEHLPSEEEQFRAYKQVVQKMGDKPVVIRTLDIGGDKIAGYLNSSAELNPVLGWRGIRFCLTRKDVFKTQLRAIYRASVYGKVKIMFPMVAQVEEVVEAKRICREVVEDLKRSRYPIDDSIEIGIMVETPAAVAIADALAKEVSFFSVGTNDLIQYTLAVDRSNSKISHLYRNLHPSIIKFLRTTVEAGHKRGIRVAICGEMCGDPLSIVVLIGLNFDEFSCSPFVLPETKKIVRSVTFDECRALTKRVMRYATADEVERETRRFLKQRCPDLSIFQES